MESLMKPPTAVVLAAGQGTRMKSDLPKVLLAQVCWAARWIDYVLDALSEQPGSNALSWSIGYRAADVQAGILPVGRDVSEFV